MQEKRKEIRHQQKANEKKPLAKTRGKAIRTHTTERIRSTATRNNDNEKTVQQGQRQASYTKQEASMFTPEFRPCALTGPDGQTRPGWEMIVGGMVFGKADAKETLLAYYSRLHDPLPSGHWKERAWQPTKRRAGGQRPTDDSQPFHKEADLDFESEATAAW